MANKTIGHIGYSLVARLAKPNDKTSEKKIYPVAQTDETVNLRTLAKHMREHGSTFSVGTLEGVLTDMVDCVVELVKQGYSVNLDGLGRIYPSLSATGAESADSFSTSQIKRVNLRIAFDKAALAEVNTNTEFEFKGTRAAQAQAKKEAKQAVDSAMADGGGSGSGHQTGGEVDPGDIQP